MFDPLELSWLPPAPADFRERIRSLKPTDSDLGFAIQQLASNRLESAQANLFNRTLSRLRAAGASLAPLAPFRLSVLSNATTDFIADALPVAAARHGVQLDLFAAPFDQILQQVLNPKSSLSRVKSDAVLFLVDYRWLGLATPDPGSTTRVKQALDLLSQVLDGLAAASGPPVILQTLASPAAPLFGSFDRRIPGTIRDIDFVNQGIVDLAKDRNHYILDVATLCETIGSARFHDPVAWHLYKLPMARMAVPLYAEWVGRLLGAIRGKARKGLVLDLDNTLWGGVIGDDGLGGITIGQGSGEGEAFLAVQRMALDLKNRGIILAVCSKNEDATARAPFREHPEMLLREADISVFQANWVDKASNIEAIAKELAIGTDALVFLDDNPAERAQVRAALPTVAVPEIGNDAAEYPAILTAAGYFEAVSFSNEDRTRSLSYAANAKRAEVRAKTRNLNEYLDSLQMRIQHAPFDKLNRPRITQLINKTNQFNLTTKRYSEAEVTAIDQTSTRFGFFTRLADQFGDFGIVGVIIADLAGQKNCHVDTWLMSCRVLGRQVEHSVLHALIDRARSHGRQTISAAYIPSPKNMMVSDHFDKLGFHRTSVQSDGTVLYELAIANYVAPQLPFRHGE